MSTLIERYDAAVELAEADKLDEAIAALQGILEEDATFALAHSALAVYLGKQEKHEDAVKHADEVCRLEPEDPFSFIAKSIVCIAGGDKAGAEDARAQGMRLQFQQFQQQQQEQAGEE